MKTAFKTLSITIILAMTSIAGASKQGEYKFKYTYKGEKLELIETSNSWESSFERASLKCFKHFSQGKPLTQDQGLDLIDLCANPKS